MVYKTNKTKQHSKGGNLSPNTISLIGLGEADEFSENEWNLNLAKQGPFGWISVQPKSLPIAELCPKGPQ